MKVNWKREIIQIVVAILCILGAYFAGVLRDENGLVSTLLLGGSTLALKLYMRAIRIWND